MSERSFVSLDQMSVIETNIHDNRLPAKVRVSLEPDHPLQGHTQFMTLMNKRVLAVDSLLEAWEGSGLNAAMSILQRSELPVQAKFFSHVLLDRKTHLVGINNAEALLEIALKLCRAKNMYIANVGANVTGVIFQAISQEMSSALTSKLQVPLELKQTALGIYRILEQILSSLKGHNRGFLELNDLEFFFEKIRIAE